MQEEIEPDEKTSVLSIPIFRKSQFYREESVQTDKQPDKNGSISLAPLRYLVLFQINRAKQTGAQNDKCQAEKKNPERGAAVTGDLPPEKPFEPPARLVPFHLFRELSIIHAHKNFISPCFATDALKEGFHLNITLGIKWASIYKIGNSIKIIFIIVRNGPGVSPDLDFGLPMIRLLKVISLKALHNGTNRFCPFPTSLGHPVALFGQLPAI